MLAYMATDDRIFRFDWFELNDGDSSEMEAFPVIVCPICLAGTACKNPLEPSITIYCNGCCETDVFAELLTVSGVVAAWIEWFFWDSSGIWTIW